MKIYLLLNIILELVIFPCYAQKSSLKGNVKTVFDTEVSIDTSTSGRKYVTLKETIKTDYNAKKLKTNRTAIEYYMGEPDKTRNSIFLYNDKEQLLSEEIFLVEDSVSYTRNYRYDGAKCLEWSFMYDSKNKNVQASTIYRYNSNDKLIQGNYQYFKRDLESHKVLKNSSAQMVYNENEKMIERHWSKSDSTYNYYDYVYIRDQNDKLLALKKYDINGQLAKTLYYEYQYDDKENWILIKTYENQFLKSTIYREIEYYD